MPLSLPEILNANWDQASSYGACPVRAGRNGRPNEGVRHVSMETRNGKGEYYTRAFRRGGRIVREYVGSGLVGEFAAAVDELERAMRDQRAAAKSTESDGLDELDKLVAGYSKTVEMAAREALVAAGYQCHQRGEWRKTRAQA